MWILVIMALFIDEGVAMQEVRFKSQEGCLQAKAVVEKEMKKGGLIMYGYCLEDK